MRFVTPILLILFLLLQYRLWFGRNSMPDYVVLKERVAEQQITNEKLQRRNALLYEEIDDLKSGLDAVEERARNELGLIKQDEVFYQTYQDLEEPDS
ncbi:cell division protein FtsB [Neiella marina]|uniref:Cell division protein FtsB n=1 Tax=Neiella holothuriorum TaxID=2870530 RepID=A0ABS7EB79_9GAMM|nr:cell division protein FtsB [Neiella holothuriorum]MBW8189591.1 cell division protein FtsB [Neiella holothuriorum]